MTFDFSCLVTPDAPIVAFRPYQVIFEMGELGRTMYVLRSGQAQIRIGDLVLETVSEGGVVGEMALIDDDVHLRSATVVAAGDCELVEIDRPRLLSLLDRRPDLALELCKLTIRRLRATTFLTYNDPVTLLPNRYRFQELCRTALMRAKRRSAAVGLLVIDIDDFKSVNAALGYASGDELLYALAGRIRDSVHEVDTVARLGADEFGVLLEDLASSNELAPIAQGVLQAVSRPLRIAGNTLHVSASIGVSCYPGDGTETESLLAAADSAMRDAKDGGPNAYRFFSAELHALAVEALNLRNHLRQALERGEFHLNYQPRVDVLSGRIAALEALLRWRHPVLGMVPPGKFIPIAEQTGLMDAIGDWVLGTACRQLKEWLAKGMPPVRLAVNLSARQLRRADLAQRVAAILARNGIDSRHLELEITESAVMEDPARTVYMLKELREMGIAVALDDFGTEYASLDYLKRFPLDYMKIDQSFVRGVPEAREDVAITRAVITLAKNLKLKVIAEGVERPEQLAFLAQNGCEEYQGYLFAKPMPADEAEALLNGRDEKKAGRAGLE